MSEALTEEGSCSIGSTEANVGPTRGELLASTTTARVQQGRIATLQASTPMPIGWLLCDLKTHPVHRARHDPSNPEKLEHCAARRSEAWVTAHIQPHSTTTYCKLTLDYQSVGGTDHGRGCMTKSWSSEPWPGRRATTKKSVWHNAGCSITCELGGLQHAWPGYSRRGWTTANQPKPTKVQRQRL
jgi:hypothetical protein